MSGRGGLRFVSESNIISISHTFDFLFWKLYNFLCFIRVAQPKGTGKRIESVYRCCYEELNSSGLGTGMNQPEMVGTGGSSEVCWKQKKHVLLHPPHPHCKEGGSGSRSGQRPEVELGYGSTSFILPRPCRRLWSSEGRPLSPAAVGRESAVRQDR